MRFHSFARSPLRSARFERCEDRIVFSSVPWAEVSIESSGEPAGSLDVGEWKPAGDGGRLTESFSTPTDHIRDTYGFRGDGQTVAVIDSGIAWDHVALGGGFGEGHQVVGGWDFTEENDADPYDDGPAGFHGTHVAGIVGAESATHTGVAPGVDLVGLRVFNDQGLGATQWVEQALNWVHEHRNDFRFPITTVNLSLGTAWNGVSPPGWAMLEDELAQLNEDGILISAAAGNSFGSYGEPGLAYPAASPYAVPVSSVGADGQLSDFSQRHERALAAPGEFITSTIPDHILGADGNVDDWAAVSGTSMAAPYLAGAGVLVREAMQFLDDTSITQSEIHEHLLETADPIFDSVTDAFYHRLDLTQAIESLMPADDYSSAVDSPFKLGTLRSEQVLSGHLARLDDQDVFQFTAPSRGRLQWQADGDRNFDVTLISANGDALDQDARSRVQLEAGQTYTLVLSAEEHVTQFDVQLSFTPDRAVTVDGKVVQVKGTAADDTISFWVDGGYQLEVNGERYTYDMDVAWEFHIQGGGGSDELTLSGASRNNTLTLRPGEARMTGPGYSLVADDFWRITARAGSGLGDVAHFFGSDGNDRFVASASEASLSGEGYTNRAEGFAEVFAYGMTGPNDMAWLYDSPGDDQFTGRVEESQLRGAGYVINVGGFDRVYAFASSGNDTARLFGSESTDLFVGTPHASWTQGRDYFHKTHRFDRVEAYASTGYDIARFYDSRGDELFVSTPESAWMQGDAFWYKAWHFDCVYAYAFGGGQDEARFHAESGRERFIDSPYAGSMYGDTFFHRAYFFDRIRLMPGLDGRVEPSGRPAAAHPPRCSPREDSTSETGDANQDSLEGDPSAAPGSDARVLPESAQAWLDLKQKKTVRNRHESTDPERRSGTGSWIEGAEEPSQPVSASPAIAFSQTARVAQSSGSVFTELDSQGRERDQTDGGLVGDFYLAALDRLFEMWDECTLER